MVEYFVRCVHASDESGANASEYAILAALIAAVIAATVALIAPELIPSFEAVTSAL